jgi:hypothetical protein
MRLIFRKLVFFASTIILFSCTISCVCSARSSVSALSLSLMVVWFHLQVWLICFIIRQLTSFLSSSFRFRSFQYAFTVQLFSLESMSCFTLEDLSSHSFQYRPSYSCSSFDFVCFGSGSHCLFDGMLQSYSLDFSLLFIQFISSHFRLVVCYPEDSFGSILSCLYL